MIVEGYRQKGQPIQLEELKSFLWGAATRLRGQIDAAGYKEYIFPLLFFKRISDVYDEQYAGFLHDGGEEYANMQSQELAIRIPDGAHWKDVRQVTENVGQRLVEAFIRQIQVRRQMVVLLEVLMEYSVQRMAGRTRQRCRTISSPD